MWMGGLFATLFFVFMSFAAISTLIAVFEAIMSFWMDQWKFSRNKAVAINAILIPLLSLPCALGFNVWSGAELPGIGNIQAIEDFVVSRNPLIVGSLVFTLFCVSKRGWGWKNFLQEVNAGDGMHFPKTLYYWVKLHLDAHHRGASIRLGAAHLKLAFGIGSGTAFHANIKAPPRIETAL